MMIETLAARLGEPGGPHYGAPDKTPERRLATLEAAGRAAIPFTTGILVGIGETRDERIDALLAIARRARPPRARAGSDRPELPAQARHRDARRHEPCDPDEFLWTIAAAALVLGPAMHLQAPPNLTDDLGALVAAGIDDWGGVSPVTPDHVNPERPWPALDRAARRDRGRRARRSRRGSPSTPSTCATPRRGSHPDVRFAGARARPTPKGSPATTTGPPGGDARAAVAARRVGPATPARAGRRSARCSTACSRGEEVGVDEIVTLLGARGPEVARVAEVADELRREIVGDEVTFVRNRNINYTNVCTFKCRFCAFSKGPLSLNLRGDPYLLELEEIQRRVVEAVECGATEVCLQGGIHPDFDGDYYLDVARAVKEVAPDDPRARLHRARGHRRRAPARHAARATTSRRLKDAGLATLPGHRGRDPRRRGAGGHLPRQGQHRGVARGAPHSRTASACARTSRSCSAPSSDRCTSPATWCAPATCRRRPAGSPSSCRCRSCTWPRRSSCRARRAAARRSARCC